MTQPFAGYLSAYTTAVQNVLRDIYDPEILVQTLRAGDVSKFVKPVQVRFPAGKSLIIRSETVALQTARGFGTPFYESGGVGRLLPNPAQSPQWDFWKVAHTDIMGISVPVRYAFPTEAVWDSSDVTNCAEYLSGQTVQDLGESIERRLVGNQAGAVAKVVGITNTMTAWGGAFTAGSSHARLWLDRAPVLLHSGAVIDVVHSNTTPACGSSLRTITIKHTQMENPASSVWGFIEATSATGTTGSSFTALNTTVASSGGVAYLYLSGEWDGSSDPNSAPAATSGKLHPYGLDDIFKSLSGTSGRAVGTMYNQNRATQGNQWTVPIVLDKYTGGANVAVDMAFINSLIAMLYHKRTDEETLMNYAFFGGPNMITKLTELTSSANRRMDDGVTIAKQPIVTNYGFDGVFMHSPMLGAPVAIQPVRGLTEDRIYAMKPDALTLMHLGEMAWHEWSPGVIWQEEGYVDGNAGNVRRTLVKRADRLFMFNTIARTPAWMGGLLGIRP